jgi:predicted oxidoreductase
MRSIKSKSIIAGTMNWGVWGVDMAVNHMAKHIAGVCELGIRAFDHADIYGGYTTEETFGAAFEATGIAREEVTFITKCGIQYPLNAKPGAVKHYDYSPAHIRNSCENSLRKLRTDYVDLLLLHRPSPLLNPREAIETLVALQSEGKILNWGLSNFTPSQIQTMSLDGAPAWNQIECSITHTNPLTDGTLDTHLSVGIGTMVWSPLGDVFKTPESEKSKRIREVLLGVEKKYQATAAQLLLSWLFKHPTSLIPVVGTTRLDRLKELNKSQEIELETNDWFALLEASWGHKVP